MIAGQRLATAVGEGADMMTMSTYKSLGGPPAGLLLTNDAALAERVDDIAYPGLTANFDVAKSAALAMTLMDWKAYGKADYGAQMRVTAKASGEALSQRGLPVHGMARGGTTSHQLAIEAAVGAADKQAAKLLRPCNIFTAALVCRSPPWRAIPMVSDLASMRSCGGVWVPATCRRWPI